VEDRVYEVGGIDAPPWAAFQSLDDAAFGPDGTLYLLDARSNRVVAVTANGGVGQPVGRTGEGPGEFRSAGGIAALEDGSLVVFDASKRGFLHFLPDGTPMPETRPDMTKGVPDGPFTLDGSGNVLAFPTRIITGSMGHAYFTTEGTVRAGASIPVLRVPLTAQGAITVATQAAMPRREAIPPGSVNRPFEPLPSFAPMPGDGLALYQAEDYEIEVFDVEGTHLRTLTRPLSARPLEPADRRAYQESLEEEGNLGVRSLSNGGGAVPRRPPPDPSYYPVITPILGITGSGSGSIWVLRRAVSDPTRGGPVDLFAVDGKYLGTLPETTRGLPAAFGPDGLVVFLDTGEFDVPVARVYRIPAMLR
jgi:hypothetical protein